MEKEKVMTFNGALNYLGVSNKTFYDKYRTHVKPCGIQGKANLYRLSDLDKRRDEIKENKFFNKKFEIVA